MDYICCLIGGVYVCVVVFKYVSVCVCVSVIGLYKVISKAGRGMICRAEMTPFMDVECLSTRHEPDIAGENLSVNTSM